MKKILIIFMAICSFFNYTYFPISKSNFYCDTIYFETGGTTTYTNELISFDNYTLNETNMNRSCPVYRNLTQLNSCAPMAGSIVIGYYDVIYNNLILNFDSGYYYNNKFYYRGQNDIVNEMKENLYDLMGTNTIEPGTSFNQFKNGLREYVVNQGYNITYNNCGNNLNLVLNSFNSQYPVALFLNSYIYYDFAGISFDTNQMNLLKRENNNGHVVIAYGYKQYKFYNNGNLTRTDNYLVVCFGDGTNGLLKINDVSCIDYAIAINIY